MQFGLSGATASSSHLQILPLLCIIEESPSLKMYGHKLWQSPAVGRAGRAKFGSLDQTGSKTRKQSIPSQHHIIILLFPPYVGVWTTNGNFCHHKHHFLNNKKNIALMDQRMSSNWWEELVPWIHLSHFGSVFEHFKIVHICHPLFYQTFWPTLQYCILKKCYQALNCVI